MTTIRKLLIANRGEIASRIIDTARRMDIATVAIYSDSDADAPYVKEADEAIALAGNAPSETYLRIDLIIAAALRANCDAIHPGYGFLSESAPFAMACTEAGLIFVGPPPEAIAAMGSKIIAKELMAAAGVPILAGITIFDEEELGGDLEERAAKEVEFPLLVKAAYGGGGRGMRAVNDPGELLDAIASARREAASAFGNGTVFLEHYVQSPRHIEVQIFADTHGNAVHLFERECSIQRRYQKIIEESPSVAVSEELRADLGAAALKVANAIGYVGAGTVEFVMGSDERFYFLEVNTRLQVEHPVTEAVTGLDLVELQLQVAEGNPLPERVRSASITGWAIEARLYAEDVAAGFLPATGNLVRFEVPAFAGVRVDTGVSSGSKVDVHYDSMLAKVIAHAATRDEARRLLARALSEAKIHGVTSNRDLLVAILREDEFAAGAIDTGYLSRHNPIELSASSQQPAMAATHALAASLAGQAHRRESAKAQSSIPSGWRNVQNAPQRQRWGSQHGDLEVAYSFRRGQLTVAIDGSDVGEVVLHSASPTLVDLAIARVRHRIEVNQVGEICYLDSSLGSSVLHEVSRFPEPDSRDAPGSLLAPMPGTVLRVLAAAGDEISAGDAVVVLEAMKMECTVCAPVDGFIHQMHVSAGQTVDVGFVLAVMEEVQ
jgi:acetyl/propionyl-CoA carboxylase alpha subunit